MEEKGTIHIQSVDRADWKSYIQKNPNGKKSGRKVMHMECLWMEQTLPGYEEVQSVKN